MQGRERWVVAGAAINGVVSSRLTYPGHKEGIRAALVRARRAGEVRLLLAWSGTEEQREEPEE